MEKLKKILMNKWIIAFLLIPYIKPATELTGKFDIIFDLLKIVNSIFIVVSYVFILKKPSKIISSISIFQSIFLVSTLINKGRLWWGIVQVISVVSLCALLELVLKLDKKNGIKGFVIALGIMAFVTVCTMFIFYPNGMYTVVFEHKIEGLWHIPEKGNYLWGFDNSSVFKFITVLIILMIYSEIDEDMKNKVIALVMILLTVIAFIYVKSLTAAMACLMVLAYYVFLIIYKKSLKILNFRNCIILILAIFAILMFFNKDIKILQKVASSTDKVTSFNYRFTIWENTLNEVKDSWLIGYGHEERMTTAKKIGIDHPHNVFLDVLYRGGIVGIAGFVALFVVMYKTMMKNKNTKIANIITIGLFALFCISQMDYYNDQYLLFLLYILAYNVEILTNNEFNIKKEVGENNEEG